MINGNILAIKTKKIVILPLKCKSAVLYDIELWVFRNVSLLCNAILILRFAIEGIAMYKDKMQAVLIFQTMISP